MSRKGSFIARLKVIAVLVVIGAIGTGIFAGIQAFENYQTGKVEAAAVENLERARSLVDAGNTDEAGKLLDPILTLVENPQISPKALVLQAEIDLQNGDSVSALKRLRTVVEDFPESAERPDAALRYARLLETEGRTSDALAVYEDIQATAPPALRAPAQLALARHYAEEGDAERALSLYEQVVRDAEVDSDAWFEAQHALGAQRIAALFSHLPTEDSKVYRVEPGDTLTRIGSKLNTTQGLLMGANKLDSPGSLYVNQNLKYTPKDFEIVIDLDTCRLYLLDSKGVFQVYRVGLGKPGNETTPGRYRIGNKQKDPTWYKPGFGPIPPGDPSNELGTRWMPLIPEEPQLPTDLGIHGTIEPDSIGKYTSMGCPRLHNEMVEELYNLVVRATPVRIVDGFDPTRAG